MQRLKVMMDEGNHLSIGNTHIFANFTKMNLDKLKRLHPDSIQKIHIFISNHYSINESLKFLIQHFGRNKSPNNDKRTCKIIIHVPGRIKVLKTLLYQYLSNIDGYIIVSENKQVDFCVNSRKLHTEYSSNYYIIFNYTKDSMMVSVCTTCKNSIAPIIQLPTYYYDYSDLPEEEKGIFDTPEMRLNPELFKDKLIEGFKRSCPPSIIKSFKTDNEIFEYIMQQGEWENSKEVKQ